MLYQGIIVVATIVLASTTVIYCLRNYNRLNKKILSLILLLALFPSIGLYFLDAIFDKNLTALRYVFFGLFPFVFLLYWGIANIKSRAVLAWVLFISIALQVLGNNWTSVCSSQHAGSYWRTLSLSVNHSPEKNKLVVIMAGYGRGVPSAVIYEMSGDQMILLADDRDDISNVIRTLENYKEIWLALAFDKPECRSFQSDIINRLIDRYHWQLIENQNRYVCLKKPQGSLGRL